MATKRFPKGPTLIAVSDTRPKAAPEPVEDPFEEGEETPLNDNDLTLMERALLGGSEYEIEIAHILKLITELRWRRSVMDGSGDDG